MAAFESVTGIKLASLIGGAVGSLVTLSYLPSLSRWQQLGAYTTGLACAVYVPPFVSYFMELPAILDGPLGFVCGISGMGLVGAVIAISRDPIGAWQRFRNGNGGSE